MQFKTTAFFAEWNGMESFFKANFNRSWEILFLYISDNKHGSTMSCINAVVAFLLIPPMP